MKNVRLLGLAFGLTIVMASAVASAQTDDQARDTGWYLGAGGMYHQETDADAKVGGVHDTIKYDGGWGIAGSGGYAWGNGFRTEGEIAYDRSELDKVTGNGGLPGIGHLNNTDLMGNVLYDIDTGTRFTPYVGVGAGLAIVGASDVGVLSGGRTLTDQDEKFAYQGIAGVSAAIDRNWAVTADYRYVGTTDSRLHTSLGDSARIDNNSNNILVGVRYTFDQPEPAPPMHVAQMAPPPAPRPAPVAQPAVAPVPQSFMVFFDFNKSILTPEAKRIIASAVQDYQKGGYVEIVVTGHTDTVGSDKYNMKLGERRAAAVKKEMIADGLSPSSIKTVSAGKTGLLVPTADGVREAQNRRAEIVLDKQ